MGVDQGPDPSVEEPQFRIPFSDADRDLLEERVPDLLGLFDETLHVREALEGHRLLGARETLSGIRALEMIGRHVETMSIELLAHYRRTGDSAAHGYRSPEQLLVGEFRISSGEARRRKILSETLVSRISETGESLEPLRPAVAAEYADGRISADEAKVLCDAVDDLPPTIRAKYADRVEKTLVELAPTVSLTDVPKLSQRIIQHIDPDGKLPRSEPDPHKYNVTLTQQRSGDWRLRGLLDCPTGTTLRALLYGRMKDADVPVAVRPHRACNADGSPPAPAAGAPSAPAAGAPPAPAAGAQPAPATDSPPSSAVPAPASTSSPNPAATASGTPDPEVPPDDRESPTSPRDRESEPHPDRQPTPPTPDASSAQCTSCGDAPQAPDRSERTLDVDDADDYSVSSAPVSSAPASSEPTRDSAPHHGEAEGVAREDVIPQVPLEAFWEDTRVTLYADASIEVNGRQGTFVEEEPRFYLNPSGWPIHLSERVSEVAQKLLAEARASDSGEATTVVWEKILGRVPVQGDECVSNEPDLASTCEGAPGGGPEAEDAMRDTRPVSADQAEGVFADGSQSGRQIAQQIGTDSPGLARHDRFGFLLRSVARERVLHGADHALVVTATADELTKPHSSLDTHAGASTTLGSLEQWSNAAQMFVHIKDGAGRSVGIRSQGRFATRTQMAVLAARDQGCTFPDCEAPAEWCEAHHILAYSRGGQTTVDNLTLVCPFHHRWFERSGWESVFNRGFPAWKPPKSFDPRQRILFHSRFRIALMGLPPELPLGA